MLRHGDRAALIGVEMIMGHSQSSAADSAHDALDDPAVELSARRTGMSFQRTRMSADRTLMSVIRTSLALISFGFTIFQFFEHLRETNTLTGGGHASRNFGLALVLLGVAMLTLGIGYHAAFMRALRAQRLEMKAEGLIYGESQFPVSMTLIIALLLFLVGALAIASIIFKLGPFT
jgi:putative membrane protein